MCAVEIDNDNVRGTVPPHRPGLVVIQRSVSHNCYKARCYPRDISRPPIQHCSPLMHAIVKRFRHAVLVRRATSVQNPHCPADTFSPPLSQSVRLCPLPPRRRSLEHTALLLWDCPAAFGPLARRWTLPQALVGLCKSLGAAHVPTCSSATLPTSLVLRVHFRSMALSMRSEPCGDSPQWDCVNIQRTFSSLWATLARRGMVERLEWLTHLIPFSASGDFGRVFLSKAD